MKGLAGDLLGLFLGSSFLIGSGLNRQARVIRTERQRELRTEHNNSYLDLELEAYFTEMMKDPAKEEEVMQILEENKYKFKDWQIRKLEKKELYYFFKESMAKTRNAQQVQTALRANRGVVLDMLLTTKGKRSSVYINNMNRNGEWIE